MWVSPNHPDPPRQSEPPREDGKRLATFARGEGVELRVTLAEYQDRPYVSLKVWERNQAGAWWPVRGKACSIRIREIGELVEVLGRIEQEQGEPSSRREPRQESEYSDSPQPRSLRDRARQRPPVDPSKLPKPGDYKQRDFNECEGN